MKLTRQLWLLANEVFKKHLSLEGHPISREKLAEALQVSTSQARGILYSIENKDIISCDPREISAVNETELLMADTHLPFHDELAIQTMFDYIEEKKIHPTIVTILGDLMDFYKISRFPKDPNKKSVKTELKMGKQFLIDLRNRFPDAKIYFYMGNHEVRMQHYIWKNAGEISDLLDNILPIQLGLKEMKIEFIDAPFAIGKLWHLHGHEKGRGSYNPEYITNVIWKVVHDNFIVGHYHRSQRKIFKAITQRAYVGAAVGCLCNDLDYSLLNQWSRGFAIIDYDLNGDFRLRLKDIVNGVVY